MSTTLDASGAAVSPSRKSIWIFGQSFWRLTRPRFVYASAFCLRPNVHLLGAARLADGSTIFSSTEEPEPILRRAAGATAFEHVPLGEGYAHARYSLRLEAAAPSSSGFLLWHNDFETVSRMAVENGRITVKGSYAMPLVWKVAADPTGGIVGISDSFEIRRVAADRTSTRFRVPFAPLGAVYLPGRDIYAVSYVRVPDRKSTRLNSSHANISYAV